MACIIHIRALPQDYIDDFFSKKAFFKCYYAHINPIPDQSVWPKVNCDELDLPTIARKASRPKPLKRRS